MNVILKNKLEYLFKSKIYTSSEGVKTTFSSNLPIKDINILSFFKFPIPDDYIDFLNYFNGCKLFNYNELDGYSFLGSNDIINENIMCKEIYEEDLPSNIIVFCNIIGEGNYLAFRIINEKEYQILDGFHENLPNDWKVIGNSFSKLIEDLIEREGQKFWLT